MTFEEWYETWAKKPIDYDSWKVSEHKEIWKASRASMLTSLPSDEEIRKAAIEFCKTWPTGVYHTNDLGLFFEKGAWFFRSHLQENRELI